MSFSNFKFFERYVVDPSLLQKTFEKEMAFALTKTREGLSIFKDKFPSASSRGLVYQPVDNASRDYYSDWTAGFWSGMIWLAYEYTGENEYREAAEVQLTSYKHRIDEQLLVNHHDMGFLYSLSCVAAYRLTGNEEAKDTALKAARQLTGRYLEKAEILQAWGDLSDPESQGRMIVDCCMNLPLLYWASEVTGDPAYSAIAHNHAKQAAKYIIREDGSTYHTFVLDVNTGDPKGGQTAQGYTDDSAWARGQAWALYGFPLSYRYTLDPIFLEAPKKVADYYLLHLPEDFICYWDLIFLDGSGEERDTSAASIGVCGLLELASHLAAADPHKPIYENAALLILKSLAEKYTTSDIPDSNGILKEGVYSHGQDWNETSLVHGVNECLIWGDYFYMEALIRVLKVWKPYW